MIPVVLRESMISLICILSPEYWIIWIKESKKLQMDPSVIIVSIDKFLSLKDRYAEWYTGNPYQTIECIVKIKNKLRSTGITSNN
jgi:hypothetical protein